MSNDDIAKFLAERFKEVHRQIIQLTALNQINDAGLKAMLGIVEKIAELHPEIEAKFGPIRESFLRSRQKLVEDSLIELETQLPALAAAIQAWLDDETKGLDYNG